MNSRLCFCFFELVCVSNFRYFFEKMSAVPTAKIVLCNIKFFILCTRWHSSFYKVAKNFPEGKVLAHTHSSSKEIGHIVHHTNIDFEKFLVKFFSKNLQGLGRRPMENSVFFLQSFFFCAYGVKRKSGSVELVCVRKWSLFEKSSAKTFLRVKF